MRNGLSIRIAAADDIPLLQAIYAPYVKNTAITFEYEVPSIAEFTRRINCIQKKYPYLVAECNGEILGYAYADTFKDRSAYDWCVETTIYVKQDKKGLGIGGELYRELERLLKDQGILNLYACIAYTEKEDEYLTKASVSFHKKMGFEIIGHFHKCGYKYQRWYDMVWMEKHIGNH